MNPISSYRQRYRLHQAYSRYPRLAMATDIVKSTCFFGVIAGVSWFAFSATTQENRVPDNADSLAVTLPLSATPNDIAMANTGKLKQQPLLAVEIPTAVTSDRSSATNVEPLVDLADTSPVTAKVEIPASAAVAYGVSEQKSIHESDWVFLLPNDKFIIQLGSSPDWDLVYAEAKAFPTGPVAIFPFKKTPSNRIVYGYSSGIYNSLDEARRAINTFPESTIANGTWIRPVGTLKKQMMNLSADS